MHVEATTLRGLPNIFVKANYTFNAFGKTFSYVNQQISLYGISGLRWSASDPRQSIGQNATVAVDLLTPERYKFSTPGLLTSESTTDSVYLGIRFLLERSVEHYLKKIIHTYGTVPTHHLRKYPRIPALTGISTMPLQAILNTQGESIAMQVANLSPSGVLLCTENPRAMAVVPGMRLRIQLDPRGDFFQSIRFEGLVCRVLEDYNSESKNIRRYFGLRFAKFDANHEGAFLGLLRDVLGRLKG